LFALIGLRPFDEVLPADALLPRDLLPRATDELLERVPLLGSLPLRPLATAERRALAERPLAVLLEAERAREVPERFLEAPRAFERDPDRHRALLAELFLATRRLPANDLALRLAQRFRLGVQTQTPTHTSHDTELIKIQFHTFSVPSAFSRCHISQCGNRAVISRM